LLDPSLSILVPDRGLDCSQNSIKFLVKLADVALLGSLGCQQVHFPELRTNLTNVVFNQGHAPARTACSGSTEVFRLILLVYSILLFHLD
jgi:hypothetical protein